jgi:enoyl-CoA hydratase/carnithine racemase
VNAGGIVLPHHSNIRVERDEHVATVTIDRIEAKNACTGDMWVAIGAAFRELAYSGARVVILTGAGEDFCAGADLTPVRDSGAEGDHAVGDRARGAGSKRVHRPQLGAQLLDLGDGRGIE